MLPRFDLPVETFQKGNSYRQPERIFQGQEERDYAPDVNFNLQKLRLDILVNFAHPLELASSSRLRRWTSCGADQR
jgi:hypothetical protein